MTVRLIVIDNECEVPKIVTAAVGGAGFSTMVTNAPRLAIDVFLRPALDLVMIAMVMPEHYGVEVLSEIIPSRRLTKAVLMSPSTDAYLLLASQIASHPATPQIIVLHKPFRVLELSQLVARLSRPFSKHHVAEFASHESLDASPTATSRLHRLRRNRPSSRVTPQFTIGCEHEVLRHE